jgi:DNA mismatch repair protein MLH3
MIDSSKLASQTPVHGARGTFLASLSAMSLVSITSHHHLHHSHNTLNMHKSTVVSRQTPSPAQQYLTSFNHGTRVTVRDLFGNMPVRVKQRAISTEKQRGNSKEWEELRRDVVLLLLAWPKCVAVAIREAVTNEKILIAGRAGASSSVWTNWIDVPAVCTILSQASLMSVDDKPFWVSVYASTQKIAINGAISLVPSASKRVQFISFGIQPLVADDARSILHNEVNRMFINSAFGSDEDSVELDAAEIDRRAKDGRYKGDIYSNKELKGGRKGVDRWPMFYINIQQNLKLKDGKSLDIDDILDEKGSNLSAVVELLQAMIWEFLTKHQFQPKVSRSRRSKRTASAIDPKLEELEALKLSAHWPPSVQQTANVENKGRKASVSNTRLLQLDPLSINEQLPSSQLLSAKVDNPFDMWTRIKSGSKPTKSANYEKAWETSDEAANVRCPVSTAPCSTAISLTSMPRPGPRSAIPLLSSTGKVIRRPFEEVATSEVQSRNTPKVPPQRIQHSEETGEDVIAWINPVTKVKSLVNQRTGLTVRADKVNPKNSNSTSISMIRRSLNQQKLKGKSFPFTQLPSPWLNSILKTWNNPVFCPTEPSISQVSFDGPEPGIQDILLGRHHHCSQIDIDRAFKESSASIDGRISKAALSRAEVVSQVDRKFILVKLEATSISTAASAEDGRLLILIDQHAADERIRIETLFEEFFAPPTVPIESSVVTSLLDKPITFEVSAKETLLLNQCKQHFKRWGIIFDQLNDTSKSDTASRSITMQSIRVRCLPPGIIERCKIDPKLLIDLMRTESWKIHDGGGKLSHRAEGDWLQCIHDCPQGIIDMLNSRACRSAIMFNDELSKKQCELLVRRLAICKFPFQCAHGRPSLVPLVDIGRLEMRLAKPASDKHVAASTFGMGFNKWRQGVKQSTTDC